MLNFGTSYKLDLKPTANGFQSYRTRDACPGSFFSAIDPLPLSSVPVDMGPSRCHSRSTDTSVCDRSGYTAFCLTSSQRHLDQLKLRGTEEGGARIACLDLLLPVAVGLCEHHSGGWAL